MNGLERAGYLAYTSSRAFERQMAWASECIERALTLCQRPYVSWSGGKDSACVLWLVLRQAPDVPVRMLTRTESRALHGDLDAVIAEWQRRFPGMDFAEIEGDKVGAYGTRTGNIRRVLRESGDFDGAFLGLRGEESGNRGNSLATWHRLPGQPFPIHQYGPGDPHGRAGSYRICPIADWTLRDVAGLIVREDLPILAQYVAEGLAARTSLGLNRVGREMGEVSALRARDRQGFNELLLKRPDVGDDS